MDDTVLIVGVSAILSFTFVSVVLYLALRHQRHQRDMLSAERMAAIERGQLLPPETFMDPDGRTHPRARNSLRTGIITTGFGVGLVASFMAVRPQGHLWGWGLLLIAVGLAHLMYWLIRGRSEWEAAQALEQEKARAWLTQSSGGAPPAAATESSA